MLEIRGKYSSAKIFTDIVDQSTMGQILAICNMEIFKDSQIRIMSDCHAGKGCVVGTTITLKDKVLPSLVGSDIGCGMLVVELKEKRVELPKLDSIISSLSASKDSEFPKKITSQLICKKNVYEEKVIRTYGTLGGGNHFIELDKDTEGNLCLVIHSGSRILGKNVYDYYMNLAMKADEQCCTGQLLADYLHDMKLTQEYAEYNRRDMAKRILKLSKLTSLSDFSTIHNYIDTENMVLRKGAVNAEKGKKLIIPMNMRDGSLICVGKGNSDWNNSAPHGAGRLLSRADAKGQITLHDYKKAMDGIYSSSVTQGTIDEAPMAYKKMENIIEDIFDTVTIDKNIQPIYNYKSTN